MPRTAAAQFGLKLPRKQAAERPFSRTDLSRREGGPVKAAAQGAEGPAQKYYTMKKLRDGIIPSLFWFPCWY